VDDNPEVPVLAAAVFGLAAVVVAALGSDACEEVNDENGVVMAGSLEDALAFVRGSSALEDETLDGNKVDDKDVLTGEVVLRVERTELESYGDVVDGDDDDDGADVVDVEPRVVVGSFGSVVVVVFLTTTVLCFCCRCSCIGCCADSNTWCCSVINCSRCGRP
jgi:hypothetical protein